MVCSACSSKAWRGYLPPYFSTVSPPRPEAGPPTNHWNIPNTHTHSDRHIHGHTPTSPNQCVKSSGWLRRRNVTPWPPGCGEGCYKCVCVCVCVSVCLMFGSKWLYVHFPLARSSQKCPLSFFSRFGRIKRRRPLLETHTRAFMTRRWVSHGIRRVKEHSFMIFPAADSFRALCGSHRLGCCLVCERGDRFPM